jgi:hypothetical protein
MKRPSQKRRKPWLNAGVGRRGGLGAFAPLCLLFAVLIGACSYAPSDRPLETLERVQGEVDDLHVWLDDTETLQIVLSWHVYSPTSLSDSYAPADTAPFDTRDGNVTFDLAIKNPPPLRARIPASQFHDNASEDDWIAFGFLTVFDPSDPSAPINWSFIKQGNAYERFDNNALIWGGNSQLMVVYVSSETSIAASIGQEYLGDDVAFEPGLNLVHFDEDEAGQVISGYSLSFDEPVALQTGPNWLPYYEVCRWNGQGITVGVWPDGEDFPSEFPHPADVTCTECGSVYEQETCQVTMEVLCNECVRLQVWKPEEQELEGWPCKPDGRECVEGIDPPTCYQNQRYECDADVWVRVADCSSGEDCCESGCEAIE